jgi:hypothetical protein
LIYRHASPVAIRRRLLYARRKEGVTVKNKALRALESERNKLWAEARLKGLALGTPVRDRIAELDEEIRQRKAAASG